MKNPHSSCWYFYYSGAWGRKFPTASIGVLITPCIGQNFPTATAGVLSLWCMSELLSTIPDPQKTFCTLKCNKTVLCHAAQAGAHVTKLFPAHLNIIPHDFPRRQTIGRHTLSDLRAKRPCPCICFVCRPVGGAPGLTMAALPKHTSLNAVKMHR